VTEVGDEFARATYQGTEAVKVGDAVKSIQPQR
jgi:hypothetical protein